MRAHPTASAVPRRVSSQTAEDSTMRNRLAVVLGVLLLSFGVSANAATVSWNNPLGGSWGTASNWSPAQVPAAGDDVVIALPGVYTVTVNVTAAANTLTLGNAVGNQTLAIPGNSLTLAAASSVSSGGILSLSGGTLGGGGPLTIGSTMNWTGGTLGGSAPLTISAGAMLAIGGGADKFLNPRTIENFGTVQWNDGRILFQNNAVFNNHNLFDIRSDSQITSSAAGGTLNNSGTIRKQVAAGTTTIVQFITFANTGTIDILSGVLTPLSATLNAGTNITGSGFLVNGGTVSIDGASTVTGTMGVAGGNLTGASTLTVNGVVNWTGGTLGGNGAVDVANGGTLNVAGGADKFLNVRTINNTGDIVWTQGRILFQNNGVLNNLPGGTFDIRADETMTSSAVGGTINNSGLIVKSAGAGNAIAVTFIRLNNNAGTIHVPSGTLTFQNAGLNDGTQITGTGYLINGGTNSVTGTATVVNTAAFANGTLDGAGTFRIEGTLNWTGGTMNTAAGTTLIPVGGTLNLSGGADKFINQRTIENQGTTNWLDSGRVLFQNNAIFINQLGALFDAKGDSQFTSSSIGGVFRNYGTFRKSAGPGVTTVVQFIDILNDGGTFDVTSGTLTIDSTTLTLAGTSSFTGTGSTQVTGGMNGTATVAGTGLVLLGTLSGTGTITVTGTMAWNSGSMSTAGGNTNVAAGATLNIGTAADKFLNARTLNNFGTVNWTGGRILFQNNSVFNNEPGALFDIYHDNQFTSSAIGGTFNNKGTFRKSGGAGVTTIVQYVKFNNIDAVIDILSGSIVADSPMAMSGTNAFTGAGILKVTAALTGTTTLEGNVELAGGSFSGPGIITINGTLTWTSGSMTGTGSTRISAGATLNISGVADHFLDTRTINNDGTTIWDGGRILFQNNGHFVNAAGALFENRHDNQFTSSAIGGLFTNEGTFRKTVGTGTTTIVQYIPIASNNGSTFDVQSGTLVIDSTLTLSGTTTFTGAGTTSATAAVNGTGTIAGRMQLAGGGNISGSGAITVAGTLDWVAGQMSGSGSTSIAPGAILNIASPAAHHLNVRTLSNSGTTNWLDGTVYFQNNGVFNNQTGGVFSVQVDSQFTSSAIGGTFNNNGGTFTKATPGTVTMTFVGFNNSGLLDVLSGALHFNKSFTQTAGTTHVNGRIQSSTAVHIQGGILTGNGTFAASTVTNSGEVQPGNSPDTLTIEGNYTQTAAGTLTIEIDGALLYDRLSITGAFNANGTLNIVSPYSPADGETFQIMTFASRTGDFAVKNGLNVGGGKSYDPVYSPTTLTLLGVDDSTNLYVSQVDAPDPVNEGDPLTYTVTITNGAASNATGVTLTDTLPTGVTFVSATPSQGTCNGTTVVNCAIGNLAAGASATVAIVVTPTQSGSITNVADVAQTEPDPNLTNNSFSETTLVNGAPVATDDSASTAEDTPVTIDVLANDSDPNNDLLSVVSFSQPANGTVDCQGANCTYEPDDNFTGTDTFTYTAGDPGNATDTATVTITITGANDPPVATDDATSTNEDVPVTLNVLANDSDPDGLVTLTLNGSTNGSNGTVVCASNGNCTYTPAPNFSGVDTFTYTVRDPQNATDMGTVTVTVGAVNDDPVANTDTATTDEGSAVVINVLLNDTDADNDALQVVGSTNGAIGTVSCDQNGDCTYTPLANQSGSDSFTYVVDDGNDGSDTGTVNVTVNAVNAAPIATPDSATTAENTPVLIEVLTNDSDPDSDPFSITGFTQPSNGAVTCTATQCTYAPASNFAGTDTFTYTITDTGGATGTGTVTVTVTADTETNEPPVAVDDTASTTESVRINVLSNDNDPDGDPLTIISHSSAETGQVSCSDTYCTYWAKSGFRGTDNFTYTISDGSSTSTATVRITVVRNDCPAAVTLLDPAQGASVLPSGTLRWQGIGAEYYNVYLRPAGSGCSTRRFTRVSEPFVDYRDLLINAEYEWRVEAVATGCGTVESVCSRFTVRASCQAPPAPEPAVVAQATSGQTYDVTWTGVGDSTQYEIEEADNRDFAGATLTRITGTSASFTHTVGQSAQPYFYRVRALPSCDGPTGPFSTPVRIVITPLPKSIEKNPQFNVPVGSTRILVQSLFIPGDGRTTQQFSIEVDKPWLRVVPNRGLLLPTGMLVEVFADPTGLPNGTITGTVLVTITPQQGLGAPQSHASAPFAIPISINLVTPVMPVPADATPPNALIIPTVGHLGGAASLWQSDVRVTNTSDAVMKYQLTFMPANPQPDGKVQQTTIDVAPGVTTALDDIIRNWFGHGSLGEASIGFLKIVPITNISGRTVASSRTYNLTPNGTLGQFIPSIPFASFVGRGAASSAAPILSLQQIAQSAKYRTNVGLVEASGKPASLMLSIFNVSGNLLKQIPVSLAAGELKQLNGLLAQNEISLDDGRIEVRVEGGDGKVTAYASTIDNITQDPLLVSATTLDEKTSMQYVLPGAADINAGSANWRTDMRIFNHAAEPQVASVILYVEGGEKVERSVVVAPGEVRVLDSVVRELFGKTQSGGAIHVNTATPSKLVVTGRTYNQTANGTFGLFVPAVTPDEAVGAGGRTLHIPQVEDSSRYRTNVGVAEVSGKPVTIEIGVSLPDTKATPTVNITLAPNEFRQFVGILRSMGLQDVYNARVTVRVVEGEGRVTAYGAIIDAVTQDPTYVPGL